MDRNSFLSDLEDHATDIHRLVNMRTAQAVYLELQKTALGTPAL